MGICVFEPSEVLACIEAARAAGKKEIPFVKDQGVYFLGRSTVEEGGLVAAYAKGCHPEKDEDWYDNALDACDGDDFGEYFTLEQIEKFTVPGVKKIKVRVTATTIKISAA